MDREAYNKCMVPYMKGGGEDRKLRFCTGAKVCSGKAATEEEARQICLTQPKKTEETQTKTRKTRKSKKSFSCGEELATLTACVLSEIHLETWHPDVPVEEMKLSFIQAMQKCGGCNGSGMPEKSEQPG